MQREYIGRKIKEYRKINELTQEVLGEKELEMIYILLKDLTKILEGHNIEK